MMEFNWTVSVGDIFVGIGGLLALLKLHREQVIMSFKVDELWRWKKRLTGDEEDR